jgi:hypothetical protein
MSRTDEFDGYRKWLGITSRRRPPSHYEILGIKLDEDDHEVILAAAEQRRIYVESKRGIGHDDQVAEILMRIGEAEIALLNHDLRREYDRQLGLFEKRRKSRQVDPNAVRSGFESKHGRTVGEDNGIVRLYAGIVAVLCVAFAGMSLFAFNLLPWTKPSKSPEPVARGPELAPVQVKADPQEPIAPIPKIPAAPVEPSQRKPDLIDVTPNNTASDLVNAPQENSQRTKVGQQQDVQGASAFEGHYYRVFLETMGWHAAQARCKAMGGHLATISSDAENSFITALAKKTIGNITNTGVWLGGTDEQKEGQWEWVDGTPFTYSAWRERQPNNGGGKDGGENYLFLLLQYRTADGREVQGWCDQSNESKPHIAYFACEWESKAAAQGAAELAGPVQSDENDSSPRSTSAKQYRGHTYKFFPYELTWHGAKKRCEKMGGHLVTIENAEENTVVFQLAQVNMPNRGLSGVWLGGTDEATEGDWRWIDGTRWEYTNWCQNPRQPNNNKGDEHYLWLWVDREGVWTDQSDTPKEATSFFICEWDSELSSRTDDPAVPVAVPTAPRHIGTPGKEILLLKDDSLSQWEPSPAGDKSKWSLKQGILRLTAEGPSLVTKQNFQDFDLYLEFKLPPKCNSGVYLRGRYEVQLLDSQFRNKAGQPAPPNGSCGAIWGKIAPTIDAYQGPGKWNTLDVRLVDREVTVKLNGSLVINAQTIDGPTGGGLDANEGEPGPILLQKSGVGAEFRNIRIKPIGDQVPDSTSDSSRERNTKSKVASQSGPKFVPPAKKCLIIIGQDKSAVDAYVQNMGHQPAGVMTYDHISYLGLDEATALRNAFPKAAIQIGLSLEGSLDHVPTGRFDSNLDKLANWAKRNPIPIYLRPGYECDGAHNKYTPAAYVKAFRHIRNQLDQRGVKNIAYVWHVLPAGPKIADWWPGEEYVDWVALTYFAAQKQNMAPIAAFANKHGKPLMLAEAAPRGIGTVQGKKSWDQWFKPCFEDIAQYNVQALCYINWDWESNPKFRGGGWGDTRIQQNEFVKTQWLKEIGKGKYLSETSGFTVTNEPQPPKTNNLKQTRNGTDNVNSVERKKITFTESDDQIDVTAGERVIASYLVSDILPRPVLCPLRTPSGVVVTRGYPMVDGESNDHPNHVGVFVAADGVNDNAFWTTSSRDIHIEHLKVMKAEGGLEYGILSTTADWMANDGKALLEETREMQFRVAPDTYAIDFTITLKAVHEKVVFADPKEALFGIRLADWMRVESEQPQSPNGFSGQGTGKYLNSNGAKTEKDVWGHRAKWLRVEATKDGKSAGVAVFDHPQSVNHPTYWHARGYGLLAANPLGQLVFEKSHGSKNAKPLNLTLTPGKSATFRYRVLVYDGSRTKEQLDREFANFTSENPK